MLDPILQSTSSVTYYEDAGAVFTGEIPWDYGFMLLQQYEGQHATIAIWSHNDPLLLCLNSIANTLQTRVVPIPALLPAARLLPMLQQINCNVLLCDARHYKLAKTLDLGNTIQISQFASYATYADRQDIQKIRQTQQTLQTKAAKLNKADQQRVLFSSGTSGQAMAVLRPIQADVHRIQQTSQRFELASSCAHIVAGPLYHSGPAIFALTHLAVHAHIYLLQSFKAEQVRLLLKSLQKITLFVVPTQLYILQQLHQREAPQNIWHNLHRMWVAGSRFAPALKTKIAALCPSGSLFEFYGSTETGTVTVQNQADMLQLPASVGRVVEGVSLQVRGPDNELVPNGTVGRIFIKSKACASGYIDGSQFEHIDDAICIGDCGFLDQHHNLHLLGRESDMIISGGVNVHPATVEDVLNHLPFVSKSLAFGSDDPKWGQIVCAFVIPTTAATQHKNMPPNGNQKIADDVKREVRKLLSPAERPRKVFVVGEMPCNAAGKPDRNEARKLVQNLI